VIVHIIHLYHLDDHADLDRSTGYYGVVEDVNGARRYPFTGSEELWRILRRLLPPGRSDGRPPPPPEHRR